MSERNPRSNVSDKVTVRIYCFRFYFYSARDVVVCIVATHFVLAWLVLSILSQHVVDLPFYLMN